MKRIDEFKAYDEANPQIWEAFTHFAFQLVHAGVQTLSAGRIFERIRWETDVRANGDRYKINDKFEPHYARKFMEHYPNAPKFRTRVLRA